MKKIKKKILFFIGVILLSTSILGIAASPVRAHTEEDPCIVDLIAGGGNEKSAMDVGDILVWNDADFLYVEYNLIDGWCLTETHLHITSDPGDFPQTKKGNPIPGHFTYKDEWEPCKTEQTYTIPLTWSHDETIYIAAHAVVQKIIGSEPDLAGFELILPDQVTMILTQPGDYYGDPSYFDVTISGGTSLDGTYDDYCIDTSSTISSGVPYTTNVYSSYEDLPEGLVDYPENLDLVNWIINQNYVGQFSSCDGEYTYGDVQRAIWALIEDTQSTSGLGPWSQCRVDEILAEANSFGEGFEPECGDVVAVILAPTDGSQITIAQVTFAEVGLPCVPIYQEETAWGDGVDFLGRNWATYFTYSIQGWNLIGDWTLRFVYGSNYDHDLTIITQDNAGNIEGFGGYPSGVPFTHPWTMTGKVSGDTIEFTIIYGEGAPNPGYTVWGIGLIADDGSMSGTWSDSAGQGGNWMSLIGNAIWGNLPI